MVVRNLTDIFPLKTKVTIIKFVVMTVWELYPQQPAKSVTTSNFHVSLFTYFIYKKK